MMRAQPMQVKKEGSFRLLTVWLRFECHRMAVAASLLGGAPSACALLKPPGCRPDCCPHSWTHFPPSLAPSPPPPLSPAAGTSADLAAALRRIDGRGYKVGACTCVQCRLVRGRCAASTAVGTRWVGAEVRWARWVL